MILEEAVMRKFFHSTLLIPLVLAIAATPSLAESKQEAKRSSEEGGVQQAIAYQRAKDRADAAQARKEALHPEHFTYAQPQQNRPGSLATQQRHAALDHSPKAAPAGSDQK